jgi:hypothetical protein
MSEINFDDLEIEIDDVELEYPQGKIAKTLPLSHPSTIAPTENMAVVQPIPLPPAFNAKQALSLIDDPDDLFDFSTTKLSPQQQLYIVSYAVRGTKMGACKLAGISYGVVEKWMKEAEFSQALQNAVDIVQDSLEEELIRRAMNGSDQLLLAAIKAAKPDKYAAKSTSNVNVNGEITHTWADLAKQATIDLGNNLVETTYEEVE